MGINDQGRGAGPAASPARPAATTARPVDPSLKLAADLADEKARSSRLEARLAELQQEVKDLNAAALKKDGQLAEAAQALRQGVLDREALVADATRRLQAVRLEADLYRAIVDGLVQLGDTPALVLSGGLGECVQAGRHALAAYPAAPGVAQQ